MNPRQIEQALKEVILVGLAGRPGSGKEFTGDTLLRMHRDYSRIVMSDLITREKERGSAIGMLMKEYQNSGHLAPDEHVINLFFNEVAALHAEGCRCVLADGFPRNINQHETLRHRKARFVMFFFELDPEIAIERMLKRGRVGEDRAMCLHRQQVFMDQTWPMIDTFRKSHPDSFVQIDGSLEGDARAAILHRELNRLNQMIEA